MIIVSQDKKIITNFDNTLGTQIEEHIKNSDGEKDYKIQAITEKRTCIIGIYETEERAKEVLREIVSKYKEYATISNVAGNDIKQIYTIPRVYEMPED